MLPNGYSTVSRRTSSILGRAARRSAMRSSTDSSAQRLIRRWVFGGATRWFERAGPTGTGVAVIDYGVALDLPVVAGLETLSAGAKIGVAARVVAKLFPAEQRIADRRPALWASDIGIDTGLLAGLDVLTFVIALVGDGIDPRHTQHFFSGAG